MRKNTKYCGRECAYAAERERWRQRNRSNEAPRGNVGAISELQVAIDLLAKGYVVFRSISPHGPCDLAVLKDGKLIKVEVATGYLNSSGQIQKPQKSENHDFDILAVVVQDQIKYFPEKP
jgi:hypothetical protein